MTDTHLPTSETELDYMRHEAAALGHLAGSYEGHDYRAHELAVARAAATAQLATASAIVLLANAIREGWEDEPDEPDEADVVDLRVARQDMLRDGIPDVRPVGEPPRRFYNDDKDEQQ